MIMKTIALITVLLAGTALAQQAAPATNIESGKKQYLRAVSLRINAKGTEDLDLAKDCTELANFCPKDLWELGHFAAQALGRIRRRPRQTHLIAAFYKPAELF